MLREEEAAARGKLSVDMLTAEPRLAPWRKPSAGWARSRATSGRRSRRFCAGCYAAKLPAINALVDISNIVSLRHRLPVGGHAVDVLTRDIALRPASRRGIVPFGSQEIEHPAPGNSSSPRATRCDPALDLAPEHSLSLPETTAVEINIDGLPPVAAAEVEAAARDVMALVARFSGGPIRFEVLSCDHPRITLGG